LNTEAVPASGAPLLMRLGDVINFKLATLAHKALASGSPAYLSSLLTSYDPVNSLRSLDQLPSPAVSYYS